MNQYDKGYIQGIYNKVADCILQNKKSIISILCQIETYKTAINEIDKTVRTLRRYGDEAVLLREREAMGKVAVFLPFNMPLYSLVLYSFGALYVGNEVHVRPSKYTSRQLLEIYSILAQPLSLLKLFVVEQSGKIFLQSIIEGNEYAAVVFTGQWDSVLDIAAKLPSDIKLIYSGSGVCPLIIRDDADIDFAVKIALESRLFNSGQDCLCTERLIVHRKVSDEFINKLVNSVSDINVGDNYDEDTIVGPLIASCIVDRAYDLIDSSNCEIVFCGTHEDKKMNPVVLITTPGEPVFRQEKFAPVFSIVIGETNDELQTIANDSEYCLGVTIVGGEYPKESFRAPHVTYNSSIISYEEEDAHRPFGGKKRSGFILHNGIQHGGPILFSIETSNIKKGE